MSFTMSSVDFCEGLLSGFVEVGGTGPFAVPGGRTGLGIKPARPALCPGLASGFCLVEFVTLTRDFARHVRAFILYLPRANPFSASVALPVGQDGRGKCADQCPRVVLRFLVQRLPSPFVSWSVQGSLGLSAFRLAIPCFFVSVLHLAALHLRHRLTVAVLGLACFSVQVEVNQLPSCVVASRNHPNSIPSDCDFIQATPSAFESLGLSVGRGPCVLEPNQQ